MNSWPTLGEQNIQAKEVYRTCITTLRLGNILNTVKLALISLVRLLLILYKKYKKGK